MYDIEDQKNIANVSKSKKTLSKDTSLISEITIALVASVSLGLGSLFLLQWTAVFV